MRSSCIWKVGEWRRVELTQSGSLTPGVSVHFTYLILQALDCRLCTKLVLTSGVSKVPETRS